MPAYGIILPVAAHPRPLRPAGIGMPPTEARSIRRRQGRQAGVETLGLVQYSPRSVRVGPHAGVGQVVAQTGQLAPYLTQFAVLRQGTQRLVVRGGQDRLESGLPRSTSLLSACSTSLRSPS